MVANCEVLRCLQTAGTGWAYPSAIGLIEYSVCNEHKQALDRGEPWTIDDNFVGPRPPILMGAEVRPHFTNWRVQHVVLGPAGRNLIVRGSLMGHGEPQDVEFSISPKDAIGLAHMLTERAKSAQADAAWKGQVAPS